MKGMQLLIGTALVICIGAVSSGYAQKGMGETTGIAQSADKPGLTPITGKVVEIKVGPCEATTGRSAKGIHLLLQADEGQQTNLHLGPVRAVADLVDQLSVGETVSADAFRTDAMPANAYIAQAVTLADGQRIELRDTDLRPSWAQARGQSKGKGQGQGPGCCGRGRRGPCW